MAKKTVAFNPKTGKTYTVTKAMQASETRPVGWTRGPDTIGRRIARNLWG